VLHLFCGSKIQNYNNFETETGNHPFKKWVKSLKDKTTVARIYARLTRLEVGNFGDARPVGNGVMELRFTFGGGIRIYFGHDGEKIVVLLNGGDKSSQEKDIQVSHEYWADYLRRNEYEKEN
jgi:putative addiction module killer protein